MAAKRDGSQAVVRAGDLLAVGRLGAGTAQGDQGGKVGKIILNATACTEIRAGAPFILDD